MDAKTPRKIFIFYGHDEEAKKIVVKFVENLGLKPVIQDRKNTLNVKQFQM